MYGDQFPRHVPSWVAQESRSGKLQGEVVSNEKSSGSHFLMTLSATIQPSSDVKNSVPFDESQNPVHPPYHRRRTAIICAVRFYAVQI